jgi:hypothetical protein
MPRPLSRSHPPRSPRAKASIRRWIVVALLASAADAADAQAPSALERLTPGVRLRVRTADDASHRLVGRLLAPAADSLLLTTPAGPPVAFRTSRIASLEVSRGRSLVGGALRGLVLGAPLGFGLGTLFGRSSNGSLECPCLAAAARRHYGGTGALAGAITGLVAGAFVGHERWRRVPLAGRS